jgi:hypothetical protein
MEVGWRDLQISGIRGLFILENSAAKRRCGSQLEKEGFLLSFCNTIEYIVSARRFSSVGDTAPLTRS